MARGDDYTCLLLFYCHATPTTYQIETKDLPRPEEGVIHPRTELSMAVTSLDQIDQCPRPQA